MNVFQAYGTLVATIAVGFFATVTRGDESAVARDGYDWTVPTRRK